MNFKKRIDEIKGFIAVYRRNLYEANFTKQEIDKIIEIFIDSGREFIQRKGGKK
jgi:hypothetical protein